MSSKDNDEGRVMHSKSDYIEIIINDKVDEFIEELFKSLLSSFYEPNWVANIKER